MNIDTKLTLLEYFIYAMIAITVICFPFIAYFSCAEEERIMELCNRSPELFECDVYLAKKKGGSNFITGALLGSLISK